MSGVGSTSSALTTSPESTTWALGPDPHWRGLLEFTEDEIEVALGRLQVEGKAIWDLTGDT
jgi:hypothetical protein